MDYGTLLEHFLCYNNKCTNRLLPENKGGEERMKKKAWRSLLSLLLAFTMVCSVSYTHLNVGHFGRVFVFINSFI